MKLLVNWLFSALALMIVAHLVSGFYVANIVAALIASVVIGFVNATLGALLKIVTFPFTIITFGIFWFVINAAMLKVAAIFVPGFQITGFGAAFIGAVVLSLVNLLFRKASNTMFQDN